MQADYHVNLHFNQSMAQKTGYAFKIGDKGCTFHIHCEDLEPTGMYPHIVFNHPNNTCVEGVPTGSGRDYDYTIQGNEFNVIGKTIVDLKFYDDNLEATQRISTASFIIEIIPDTYTDFDEGSSSYADSLERAREEINAAILELQGAEEDLDDMSTEFADTLQDYIDAFGNTGPINPRGTYDPATPYVPRDAVAYTAGGKTLTYINKQACTGIAPTDPDYGAQYWQIMIDVAVGGAFSALEDVSIDPQTLADGQVPVYNDTDDVWENKTILENSLASTATDKALTAAKGKELQDNKQDKTLETALTIDGTVQTTVEGALGAINAYVDDVKEDTEGELSHENLIDNPWFTVNQRNFSSENITSKTYTVDRWYGQSDSSATFSISSNGFSIAAGSSDAFIMQIIDNYSRLNGKVITASVMLSDGTIKSGTVTLNTGTSVDILTETTFKVRYASESHGISIVSFEGNTTVVKAVKLELGSISTLAHDTEPNYTTELSKCQFYFERVKIQTSTNEFTIIGMGYGASNTKARIIIWCKPKRTAPTIAYSGTFYAGNTVTDMSYVQMSNGGVVVEVTTSGLVQDNMYVLVVGNKSYYVDIKSDL